MKKSTSYYVIRHTGTLFLTCMAIFVLFFVLGQFAPNLLAGIPPGSEVGLVVALLIVPPMLTGGAFYKFEQRQMRMGEGWRMAFLCTIGGFVALTILAVGANTALYGSAAGRGDLAALLSDQEALVIGLGFIFVVVMLLNRLFYWASIKGALRKAGV